jgi:hypothetical protein
MKNFNIYSPLMSGRLNEPNLVLRIVKQSEAEILDDIINGTGKCKTCGCSGFISTQNDDVCENNHGKSPMDICGHSKAVHE